MFIYFYHHHFFISLQVPQVENFSDTAQLHGGLILELKKKWPCQSHQGEHGQVGHCYVAPTGEHIRLNALRLKAWAAAIVCLLFSLKVTLLICSRLLLMLPSMSPPISLHLMVPTMAAFQAERLVVDLVRMWHSMLNLSPTNSNQDMIALLVTTLLPLIRGLSRK